MHVFAFFGILAIVVTRILLPPEAPVHPPVHNAAGVSVEQRERMKGHSVLPSAAAPGGGPADAGETRDGGPALR